MEIGPANLSPGIHPVSSVGENSTQSVSSNPPGVRDQPQKENVCQSPLPSMSTETFMSLREQSSDGAQSTLEGLKKILEIVAMMQLLKALQEA